jgi:integrase
MKGKTFRHYAEQYIEDKSPGWTERSRLNIEDWLRLHVYSVKTDNGVCFGDLPIEMIDTRAVLAVLRRIWTTKTPTARNVRWVIEAVIDFASAIDNLDLNNPARWRGRLKAILASPSAIHQVESRRSLHYSKAPECITVVREHSGVAAAALEFDIHAPVRITVAVSAEWSEFHPKVTPDGGVEFPDRKWSIPQAKMKARKKIRYPGGKFPLALTDPMIEILKRMWPLRRDGNKHVFPGRKPGAHVTRIAVYELLRMCTGEEITVHGFRSTVMDWTDERTICEDWVKKMLLGHSVGDQTEQAYRRSDLLEKRTILQEAWSEYLTTGEDLRYDIGAIFLENNEARTALPIVRSRRRPTPARDRRSTAPRRRVSPARTKKTI